LSDIFRKDELPKRAETHVLEAESEIAFETALSKSGLFQYQSKDRNDYGTDYNLEANKKQFVSNVRVSAQLKGTDKEVNDDGSVSISIDRKNLNYLASQPYSIYVCYHRPTNSLYVQEAESVISEYETHGQAWRTQTTVSIKFTNLLTEDYIDKRVLSFADQEKANRLDVATSQAEDLPQTLAKQSVLISVPDDPKRASKMLMSLSSSNKDEYISDNFDAFFAVLERNLNSTQMLYLAEINLGITGLPFNEARVRDAIDFLNSIIDEYGESGIAFYNLGNAYSVLNDVENSNMYFLMAMLHLEEDGNAETAAMTLKNLGTNYEALGNNKYAKTAFERALHYDPELAEAHFALGLISLKNGNYSEALEHLDSVILVNRHPKILGSVQGWRVNALFNVGNDRAAFREIFSLIAENENSNWAWSWCSRQVQQFGQRDVNLDNSIRFWKQYLQIDKNDPLGITELLSSQNMLLQKDSLCNIDSFDLEAEVEGHHADEVINDNQAALLYDKIGHRYQSKGEWLIATEFFKKAHDLVPGPYACCLATAYNHLNLFPEALDVLITHEHTYSNDDVYWFQRGLSLSRTYSYEGAVEAFRKAVELNDNYEKAWYNLAGNYFNNGENEKAKETFEIALQKSPDDAMADQARKILAQLS